MSDAQYWHDRFQSLCERMDDEFTDHLFRILRIHRALEESARMDYDGETTRRMIREALAESEPLRCDFDCDNCRED